MPKIFSEADKQAIRSRLLEAGLAALERSSYRRIAVDDLARQAGIAKGTFYHFYPSKEAFFYELMLCIKQHNRSSLLALFHAGPPSREDLTDCLVSRYTVMKSVYAYFPPEDLAAILEKIPQSRLDRDDDSLDFAALVAQSLRPLTARETETIVGMFNVLGLAAAHRGDLDVTGYEPAIRVFCGTMADYILGGAS